MCLTHPLLHAKSLSLFFPANLRGQNVACVNGETSGIIDFLVLREAWPEREIGIGEVKAGL